MAKPSKNWIEYMCCYCGAKQLRSKESERPYPGTCRRKGKNQPHSQVKNENARVMRKIAYVRGYELGDIQQRICNEIYIV